MADRELGRKAGKTRIARRAMEDPEAFDRQPVARDPIQMEDRRKCRIGHVVDECHLDRAPAPHPRPLPSLDAVISVACRWVETRLVKKLRQIAHSATILKRDLPVAAARAWSMSSMMSSECSIP